MNEDLMRGMVARAGQLLEVIAVNVAFNTIAVSMGLFGVYLVTAVRTPEAYTFTPYVVAGSVAMAAKGGFLLHRKWDEYASAEKTSQERPGTWVNPSVNVSKDSRKSVLIANILALAAIALPLLVYCYMQILATYTLSNALVRIIPSLAIVIFSIFAWIQSAK